MTLPNSITEQDFLLTLNINDDEGVTHPVDGYKIKPLFFDPENGIWVIYASFPPGTLLPKHYHTGTVHFFTVKGEWNYVEYPSDVQKSGSYLYEPGGSIHQLSVPADAKEPAEGFMVIAGANINFDSNDQFMDIHDAGGIESALLAVCEAMGQQAPRYIKVKSGAAFSDA